MPYQSAAQRSFFHSPSAKKAGITDSEVKEYDQASKGKSVPDRIGKKSMSSLTKALGAK